jgi:hypothetical protein
VTVAEKNGNLLLTIATRPALRLRPTFQDAFLIEDRGMSVRFLRDGAGKVTGFRVGDDRVWDLRFARVE